MWGQPEVYIIGEAPFKKKKTELQYKIAKTLLEPWKGSGQARSMPDNIHYLPYIIMSTPEGAGECLSTEGPLGKEK